MLEWWLLNTNLGSVPNGNFPTLFGGVLIRDHDLTAAIPSASERSERPDDLSTNY